MRIGSIGNGAYVGWDGAGVVILGEIHPDGSSRAVSGDFRFDGERGRTSSATCDEGGAGAALVGTAVGALSRSLKWAASR